jgi:hypothetical protein
VPAPAEEGSSGELPARVPAAIRDVSFPTGRGYERQAVDAYVNQVNRLIAELEVSRSPQAAVRHALDRVGQPTSREAPHLPVALGGGDLNSKKRHPL